MLTRHAARRAVKTSASAAAPSVKRGRRAAVDVEDVGATDWAPTHWRQHVENIGRMRSAGDAPVDTMGASCCADDAAQPPERRVQVLLSLMLSSQTRDETTSAAMKRLRDAGCALADLSRMSEAALGKLIKPVSFWKTKAKHIKETVDLLQEKHEGDIPHTVAELCALPGVGPKMAHLTMLIAWNEVTGIGVDTHVHSVCNRLGWLPQPTKQPEQTRKALEAWLPRDHWVEINQLLVGFGQQTCTPVKPHCDVCFNRDICSFARLSVEGQE